MIRGLTAAIALATALAVENPDSAPGQAEPGATPPVQSHKYVAKGLFRVTCEPDSVHSNLISVQGRLKSPAFKDAVTKRLWEGPRNVAGGSLPEWRIESAKFDLGVPGVISWHQSVLARMEPETLNVAVAGLTPDDWLSAIAKTLEAELRDHDEARASMERKREILRSEVQDLEKRLDDLRQQATLVQEGSGPDSEAQSQVLRLALQAASTDLQRARTDYQSNVLQTQGLEARREALESQIEELGKKVGEGAGRDPVVVELAKVVKAREMLLAAVGELHKTAAPGGGLDAVANAEGGLAEARAELAKYQRVAAQSAGGDRLTELNKRLADTQVELAEAEARQGLLTQQLEGAARALDEKTKEAIDVKPGSAELDRIQTEIQIDESQYRKLSERLRDAELELKLYRPPTVTVIPQQ